jgi:3-hydroxybutyryl-CoA dehydrogenase
MKEVAQGNEPVLLVGSNKMTYSIALCLQKAGQPVILSTADKGKAIDYITAYSAADGDIFTSGGFEIIQDLKFRNAVNIAIVITDENLSAKKQLIGILESCLPAQALIAINTESIPLNQLQSEASAPERILGLNWVEPAITTFFLEIIANQVTKKSYVDDIYRTASHNWGKDPYVIQGETGIRMRLFAAMIREAFYLVKNGYATVEDIDRACRNDAGYYLPFAGNLRYMDLMGTYAYGMVMKDLNPELSTDKTPPDFFVSMIQNTALGMESGTGFYDYRPGETQKWEALLKQFSQQVGALFEKYPFNYKTGGVQ